MVNSSTRSYLCLPTFNIKSTSSSTISNIAHQSATRMPACASSSFFYKTLRRLRLALAVISFQVFNRPFLREARRDKLLSPGALPTSLRLKLLGIVLHAAALPLLTRGPPAIVIRLSRSGCWVPPFNYHLPNHRARPIHLSPKPSTLTTAHESRIPPKSLTPPLNPHLLTFLLVLKL
jgi:hypothetical protein